MLLDIARHWWVLLIRGICAIIFGILAFTWPGITLLALVTLYGAYALIDGITAFALGLSGRHDGGIPWWAMLLVGVLGIAAGIVTFLYPGITALALLLIIAFWAISRGIFEIIAAIRLRRVIDHEWLLVVAGVLSLAFGLLLLLRPAAGVLAVVWIIGSFAIAFGIVSVILSLKLHRISNELGRFGGGTTVHPA